MSHQRFKRVRTKCILHTSFASGNVVVISPFPRARGSTAVCKSEPRAYLVRSVSERGRHGGAHVSQRGRRRRRPGRSEEIDTNLATYPPAVHVACDKRIRNDHAIIRTVTGGKGNSRAARKILVNKLFDGDRVDSTQ